VNHSEKASAPVALVVNGAERSIDVPGDVPLLWVLREELGLNGTKYGCGIGQCGACTVHLDGRAVRSCVTPVRAAAGARITTIEDRADARAARVREAWIAEEVPQCGYCQPGMIMAVAAQLGREADPERLADQITNLCRCATYERIRRAIHRAVAAHAAAGPGS